MTTTPARIIGADGDQGRRRKTSLEGRGRLQPLLSGQPPRVKSLDPQRNRGGQLLTRLALHDNVARAQNLVAAHDFGKASRQRFLIERSLETPRVALVEARTLGSELVQEPDALLRKGQRSIRSARRGMPERWRRRSSRRDSTRS